MLEEATPEDVAHYMALQEIEASEEQQARARAKARAAAQAAAHGR